MRWLHRALDFWRPPPPSGQHAWPAMVLPSERKGGTAHRACHTAVQPQRRATVRQACRLGAGRGWLCGLSLFIISSPSTPPSCLVISYRLWHGHLLIAFSFHFFCEAVCFLWLQLHIVRACQSIRPSWYTLLCNYLLRTSFLTLVIDWAGYIFGIW